MELPGTEILRISGRKVNHALEWRDAPPAEYAVIGDPVDHSRSPKMHLAAYQALDLPYRYEAIRVSTGEVSLALDHLKALGYLGVNVTVPNKVEAMNWAIDSDPVCRATGAANTLDLVHRRSTNTDGLGFLDTLAKYEFKSKKALLLGAGGSARAIAAVLPQAGFHVSIWNRTAQRAQELATEFGLLPVEHPTAQVDLLINTTSASLQSQELPIDWINANPNGLAYDLVYGETPFLKQAASAGMQTLDGRELLVAQGARSFEWWLEVAAPRDVMKEAIW